MSQTREDGQVGEIASEPTLRLFFAIELDERTRGAVAELARGLRDAPGGAAIRWVREESFHVTLRFLGATDSARVLPLAECVRQQTALLRPFRLELGAARPFPSKRRPRFVVLDAGPADRLEELAEAVERGVVRAGFEPESRPFRAHLTLGRVHSSAKNSPPISSSGVTADVTTLGEGCFVQDAVLFKSDLHRSGARYTPLERVALGNGLGDTSSPLT